MKPISFAFPLAMLLLSGCTDDSSTGVPDSREVSVQFSATFGDEPYACGKTYSGIGAADSDYQANDLRMFVSNVRVKPIQESLQPLSLVEDGVWQHDNVALLDFGHGCDTTEQLELNKVVVGDTPLFDDQVIEQVCFDLGVPFELNHEDNSMAASPLNVSGMFWNWLAGHKFFRLDGTGYKELSGDTPEADPVITPVGFNVHLGSTGCDGESAVTPPSEICANPNLPTVCIDLNPEVQLVKIDLKALLSEVDVATNTANTPPGCMSASSDPECRHIMPAFGLDFVYTPSAAEIEEIPANDDLFKQVFSAAEISATTD